MKSFIWFLVICCVGILIISSPSCTKARVELPPIKVNDSTLKAFCDTTDTKYSTFVSKTMTNNCALSGCHVSGATFPDFSQHQNVKDYMKNGKIKLRAFDLKNMPPAPRTVLDSITIKKLQCWADGGALNN